jgi:hypothetical protein
LPWPQLSAPAAKAAVATPKNVASSTSCGRDFTFSKVTQGFFGSTLLYCPRVFWQHLENSLLLLRKRRQKLTTAEHGELLHNKLFKFNF